MKTLLDSKNKIIDIIFPFISILIAFLVWFITASVVNAEIILPSPIQTFKELFKVLGEKEFYLAVGGTLFRAVISFLISYLLAFIIAVLSAKFNVVKRLTYPLIVIARGIPTMSVILICYLAVSPKISPILIACLVILPLAYNEILSNLTSVDNNVIEACNVYGVSKNKVFKQYVLPLVLEKSFISAITLLAFSVKLTISAEAVIYTTNSLGLLMQVSKTALQTGRLFAYTLIAVLIGALLELIAVILKNKFKGGNSND